LAKFGNFTLPRVLTLQQSFGRLQQQVPLPGNVLSYRRDRGGLGAKFTVSGKIKPADQTIADALIALADGTPRIFDPEDGSLRCLEECLRYDGVTWYDDTEESQTVGGSPFSLLASPNDRRYFGHREKFNKLLFDLATPGSYGARLWEYPTAESTWGTLSISSDGTNGFTQDGAVSFTPPDDWIIATVDGIAYKFWVRCSVASVTLPATVNQIQLNNVFRCIMVDPTLREQSQEYDQIDYSIVLLQQEGY
jgi:hypothetical protein